jgi:hypothetical protein
MFDDDVDLQHPVALRISDFAFCLFAPYVKRCTWRKVTVSLLSGTKHFDIMVPSHVL